MDTIIGPIRQVLLVDDPLGRLLVSFIGLLTLICLAVTFGLIVYAWWERARIREVGGLVSPDREALLKRYQKGIVGSRLALLQQSREQRQVIDQEALSAIARSQLEGGFPTQFVRYVTGVLIIIGLLGTFIGFGRIVVEVRDILTSIPTEATVSEVMESIRTSLGQMDEAMSGLTIAFATSVAGVLGTVILSLACLGIDIAHTWVLRNLECITLSKLMPLFSSDAEAAIVRMVGTLEEHSDGLARQIVRFNGVIEQGIRSVNYRIESVVNKTIEEERQFVTELTKIRKTVANTAAGIAVTLDQSAKDFAVSVERARSDAKGSVDEIGQRIDKLNNTLDSAGATFEHQIGVAADYLRNAGRQTLRPLPDLIDRFKSVTENHGVSTENLQGSVNQLTVAMEATDRRIFDLNIDGRSFVEVISQLSEVMMARETNLQASEILFDEWMGKAATALEEVTRNLGDSMTADMAGLRHEVRQTGARVQSTADEMHQTGGQFRELIAELARVAGRLEAARHRPTGQVYERTPGFKGWVQRFLGFD